jgi:hypothetical protein
MRSLNYFNIKINKQINDLVYLYTAHSTVWVEAEYVHTRAPLYPPDKICSVKERTK